MTFDNEEALFKFQYHKPQFKPLFQLPPNMGKNPNPNAKPRTLDTPNPFLFYSTLLYIFICYLITCFNLSCLYAGADRPHTPVYWFLRRRPPTTTLDNEEAASKAQDHKPQAKPLSQ